MIQHEQGDFTIDRRASVDDPVVWILGHEPRLDAAIVRAIWICAAQTVLELARFVGENAKGGVLAAVNPGGKAAVNIKILVAFKIVCQHECDCETADERITAFAVFHVEILVAKRA